MSKGPKVMCVKCLDIIQSMNRHDFATCTCGAISIDGGSDYTRCLGYPEDFMWDFDEDTKRNKAD